MQAGRLLHGANFESRRWLCRGSGWGGNNIIFRLPCPHHQSWDPDHEPYPARFYPGRTGGAGVDQNPVGEGSQHCEHDPADIERGGGERKWPQQIPRMDCWEQEDSEQ